MFFTRQGVPINDEDLFFDLLVTAPHITYAKEDSQQVGYVAKLGETRKHKAVLSHYDVPLHRQHQIVPFVLETSGSMGTSAIKFLNRIMAAYPKSSPSSEGLLIGRLKERMAADALTRTCRRLSQFSGIETFRSI